MFLDEKKKFSPTTTNIFLPTILMPVNTKNRKSKNLVSRKLLKSPRAGEAFSSTPSERLPDEDSSVGSESTDAAGVGGISGSVLKQLAKDIEKAGGINRVKGSKRGEPEGEDTSLYQILQKRPTIYGVRGCKLRSKLSDKVAKWKKQAKKGKYTNSVLNRLGVKSFETLKDEKKNNQRDSDSSSCASSFQSNVDSDLSSEASEGEKATPKKTTPKKKTHQSQESTAVQEAVSPAEATESRHQKDKSHQIPSGATSDSNMVYSPPKRLALPPGAGKFCLLIHFNSYLSFFRVKS